MAVALRTTRRRLLPHLQRDRLGTYYFRLTVDGRTIRRSLRTTDSQLATMLASKLNYEWSMTKRPGEPSIPDVLAAFEKDGRRFDVQLPKGMRIENIDSDEDAQRAKRFIEDFADIGGHRARASAAAAADPAQAPSLPLPPSDCTAPRRVGADSAVLPAGSLLRR